MLKKLSILAGTGMTLMASQSYAAVPQTVTDAIAEAVTDIGTIGALILGVVIAIVGFNWLRRVMR